MNTITSSFEIQVIAATDQETPVLNESRTNTYRIIWIESGTGAHWIDLHKHQFENNQVICIRPGQIHRVHGGNNIKGYLLSFSESFLSLSELAWDLACNTNLLHLFSTSQGIILKEDAMPDMKEVVHKLIKEFKNVHLFKTEILKRYFKIFLIYLARQVSASFQPVTQTRNMELVQSFMKLLEKNFRQKKMVAEYASDLRINPNYLNEIIKKSTGFPASHHIRQRIALEAKRLALYSGINMKEIAYDLGFNDPCNFSKFFKTVTGANFSEFKKEKRVAVAV